MVCVNFRDLEIDNFIDDGIYNEYLLIEGATNEQIDLFEKFSISKLHLIRNKNAKNSNNKTLATPGII